MCSEFREGLEWDRDMIPIPRFHGSCQFSLQRLHEWVNRRSRGRTLLQASDFHVSKEYFCALALEENLAPRSICLSSGIGQFSVDEIQNAIMVNHEFQHIPFAMWLLEVIYWIAIPGHVDQWPPANVRDADVLFRAGFCSALVSLSVHR